MRPMMREILYVWLEIRMVSRQARLSFFFRGGSWWVLSRACTSYFAYLLRYILAVDIEYFLLLYKHLELSWYTLYSECFYRRWLTLEGLSYHYWLEKIHQIQLSFAWEWYSLGVLHFLLWAFRFLIRVILYEGREMVPRKMHMTSREAEWEW